MTVDFLVILGVTLAFALIFLGFAWTYRRRTRRAARDEQPIADAEADADVSP